MRYNRSPKRRGISTIHLDGNNLSDRGDISNQIIKSRCTCFCVARRATYANIEKASVLESRGSSEYVVLFVMKRRHLGVPIRAQPFEPSLFQQIDRGIHYAEQPDDHEDCTSKSELGSTIARKLAKSFEVCLVVYFGRKSGCQAKPVNGGECQSSRKL
jgi:hypothetical protein